MHEYGGHYDGHVDPRSDTLTLKFDIFENMDTPTLVVERDQGGSTALINIIQGDDVLDTYAWLLGEDQY